MENNISIEDLTNQTLIQFIEILGEKLDERVFSNYSSINEHLKFTEKYQNIYNSMYQNIYNIIKESLIQSNII